MALSTKNKILLLLALSAALLLSDVVAGLKITSPKSSCAITPYPQLCRTAISAAVGASKQVLSVHGVLEILTNFTIAAAKENYENIKSLSALKNVTNREKAALDDCLELSDDTLYELHEVVDYLHKYTDDESLSYHAGDLNAFISAAMTDQGTCMEGFTDVGAGDSWVRKYLEDGNIYIKKLCSIELALIKYNLIHVLKEANEDRQIIKMNLREEA